MGAIRKVLFIKNAVETLGYFSEQIALEMERQGLSVYFIDYDRMFETVDGLRRFAGRGDTALVTFNFIGLCGEEIFQSQTGNAGDGGTVWAEYGMRILNILVDHPLYYHKRLAKPACDMTVFCVDREHVRYVQRFYPEVRVKFLPLAGNVLPSDEVVRSLARNILQPDEGVELLAGNVLPSDESVEPLAGNVLPYHQRKYDLVFTANYVSLDGITAGMERLDPEYRQFYREIQEELIADPAQSVDAVMERHIDKAFGEVTDDVKCGTMAGMALIDLYVRSYYRGEIIRELAEQDIRVHVFGADWNLLPCRKPENIIHNGAQVGSAACVQAVRDAKIALNIMPWFKDGVHDRVFTAMLQKTAALTDDSRYLREQFTDGEDLVFYSLKEREKLPEQVYTLLQQEETMARIAENGFKKACAEHTWSRRAAELMKELK